MSYINNYNSNNFYDDEDEYLEEKLLFNDDFYENFPNLKPATKPQFTKYDAFGIAANTDFEPFDSIFNDEFFD